MPGPRRRKPIRTVEIGATLMKFAEFNDDGEPVGTPPRRRTPSPCSPARLVAAVAEEVAARLSTRGSQFPRRLR